MIIGASSPRVSLARTSPRTRLLLPPTLGEHVEQNVSLATSSDARLRRPVRVTVLRRADVCAMELGPAPRKHAPPQAVYPRRLMGVWGAIAPPGQFRAGFSEQFIILARKDVPTPDYVQTC